MWVWQSQALAGTSKLTAVAGCEALANTGSARAVIPAAAISSSAVRRVSIDASQAAARSVFFFGLCVASALSLPVVRGAILFLDALYRAQTLRHGCAFACQPRHFVPAPRARYFRQQS